MNAGALAIQGKKLNGERIANLGKMSECPALRFIYSHDRSAYSAARENVNQFWEYINRSQTYECGNGD
jgi:hypothetical protein